MKYQCLFRLVFSVCERECGVTFDRYIIYTVRIPACSFFYCFAIFNVSTKFDCLNCHLKLLMCHLYSSTYFYGVNGRTCITKQCTDTLFNPRVMKVSIRRTYVTTVLPWRTLMSANQLFAELQDLGLESYTTYTVLMPATNNELQDLGLESYTTYTVLMPATNNELQDLGLESYTTYTVLMPATNNAGKKSDLFTRNFTIQSEAQHMNGDLPASAITLLSISTGL